MDVTGLHKEPLGFGDRRVAPRTYSFLKRFHHTPFYAHAYSYVKELLETPLKRKKARREKRRAFNRYRFT
jgi:hypothetical protein